METNFPPTSTEGQKIDSPSTIIPPSSPNPQTTNTRAIVALVLGILSLVCCGFFAGIPAIILGRVEMKASSQVSGAENNKTIAQIGFITGIIGTVFSALLALAYVLLFALGISTAILQGNVH